MGQRAYDWDDEYRDEDDAFYEEGDEDWRRPSNEDLNLCPHGQRDDQGCDVDGCMGGADGMDDAEND